MDAISSQKKKKIKNVEYVMSSMNLKLYNLLMVLFKNCKLNKELLDILIKIISSKSAKPFLPKIEERMSLYTSPNPEEQK